MIAVLKKDMYPYNRFQIMECWVCTSKDLRAPSYVNLYPLPADGKVMSLRLSLEEFKELLLPAYSEMAQLLYIP